MTFSTQRAVDARQTRQRMLRRPGGLSYEVVLDEIALRRLPAPPEVTAAQLEHLMAFAEEPGITVRVMPVSTPAFLADAKHGEFDLQGAPGRPAR